MDNVLRIKPNMQWPLGQVFEVKDEFNGNKRGTHYFRDGAGVCRGPFHNFDEAQHHLHSANAEANRV